MCEKALSKNQFMLKYCPYRHITQEMCVKAVDAYILTLKFVPDWFVKTKTLQNLDYDLSFDDLDPEQD